MTLLFVSPLKCKVYMAMNRRGTQIRLLNRFCTPFIYCLFIEHYVYILSVGTCLCNLVNTSYLFIMYVLNVRVRGKDSL